MNLADLQVKVNEAKATLLQIESQNDMGLMRARRSEYCCLQRKKKLRTIGKRKLQSLRDANSMMTSYGRQMKTYNSWKDKLEMVKYGCQNCKRKDPSTDTTITTPYELSFTFHPENTLIKRTIFRFIHIDESSEELVGLCTECSEYLTNRDDKVGKSFQNV